MSKPTAAVRNRYQKKAFDRLTVIVPKGRKPDIDAFAKAKGETINSIVNRLLREEMGLTVEAWKAKEVEACVETDCGCDESVPEESL